MVYNTRFKEKNPPGGGSVSWKKKTSKILDFNMLIAVRRVHIFTSHSDDDLC